MVLMKVYHRPTRYIIYRARLTCFDSIDERSRRDQAWKEG
jgi:hypothetical protein